MERRSGTTAKRAGRGVVLFGVAGLTLGMGTVKAPTHDVRALVMGDAGAVRSAVTRHGGAIVADLDVVDGMIARLPAAELVALQREPGVTGVATDRAATLESVVSGTAYDTTTQADSMENTATLTGAPAFWRDGFDGSGVDVAVIDSGVQSSAFFGTRLVAGTDVSGEGNALADGFGHGTHVAGIIAGYQAATGTSPGFSGMCPAPA